MCDADLSGITKQRLTRRGMELFPPMRRRLRTVRIIGVDLLAADLEIESYLYGLGHLRGGVKACQAVDDELLYLISEYRHRFFLL